MIELTNTILIIVAIQLLLILNSLCCIGLFYASQDGMILSFLNKIPIPEKFLMPIAGCPTCMASIHSTYFLIPALLYLDWSNYSWLIFIVYIPALAGLNTALYNRIEYWKNN